MPTYEGIELTAASLASKLAEPVDMREQATNSAAEMNATPAPYKGLRQLRADLGLFYYYNGIGWVPEPGGLSTPEVVTVNTYTSLPATGVANTIYAVTDEQNLYLWGGSAYVMHPKIALMGWLGRLVSGTVAIGTGTKTTTITALRFYKPGDRIRLGSAAGWVEGPVTTYDDATGALAFVVGPGNFYGTGTLGATAQVTPGFLPAAATTFADTETVAFTVEAGTGANLATVRTAPVKLIRAADGSYKLYSTVQAAATAALAGDTIEVHGALALPQTISAGTKATRLYNRSAPFALTVTGAIEYPQNGAVDAVWTALAIQGDFTTLECVNCGHVSVTGDASISLSVHQYVPPSSSTVSVSPAKDECSLVFFGRTPFATVYGRSQSQLYGTVIIGNTGGNIVVGNCGDIRLDGDYGYVFVNGRDALPAPLAPQYDTGGVMTSPGQLTGEWLRFTGSCKEFRGGYYRNVEFTGTATGLDYGNNPKNKLPGFWIGYCENLTLDMRAVEATAYIPNVLGRALISGTFKRGVWLRRVKEAILRDAIIKPIDTGYTVYSAGTYNGGYPVTVQDEYSGDQVLPQLGTSITALELINCQLFAKSAVTQIGVATPITHNPGKNLIKFVSEAQAPGDTLTVQVGGFLNGARDVEVAGDYLAANTVEERKYPYYFPALTGGGGGGGGSTPPGGSNGAVQYNSSGAFGGFGSYNSGTTTLTLVNATLTGKLTVPNNVVHGTPTLNMWASDGSKIFWYTGAAGIQFTNQANTAVLGGLSNAGVFTLATLAGMGTRMVVADASGNLGTQAIPSGGGGGTGPVDAYDVTYNDTTVGEALDDLTLESPFVVDSTLNNARSSNGNAGGSYSVGVGGGADATGEYSVAIGSSGANGAHSIGVGGGLADADDTVAIGWSSEAAAIGAIALGANAVAREAGSVALGRNLETPTLAAEPGFAEDTVFVNRLCVLTPGEGIVLISPNGSVTKKLTLDNNGDIDLPAAAPGPVVAADITDSTAAGRALLTAPTAAAQLSALGISNHWKGAHTSPAALQAAHPTAAVGDYATVDTGAGANAVQYNWDAQDGWVAGGSVGATTTDALPEGSTNLYHTAARARAAVGSFALFNRGATAEQVTAANAAPWNVTTELEMDYVQLTAGELIAPACLEVALRAIRTGTGTVTLRVYLGTSATPTANQLIGTLSLPAASTTGKLVTEAQFHAATALTYVGLAYSNAGVGTGGAGTSGTNINTAAAMRLSVTVQKATATDTVTLRGWGAVKTT